MKKFQLFLAVIAITSLLSCNNQKGQSNTPEEAETDTVVQNEAPENKDTVTVKMDTVGTDTTKQ